jgi:hypothetical protein
VLIESIAPTERDEFQRKIQKRTLDRHKDIEQLDAAFKFSASLLVGVVKALLFVVIGLFSIDTSVIRGGIRRYAGGHTTFEM